MKQPAIRVMRQEELELEFWREYRSVLLMQVDLIERRKIDKKPRTSELRKAHDKLERSLKAGA